MSSQLPLSEAAATPNGVAFAFASGLAVKGNTVLVTYGAGDREARALVMTMEKLDVTWLTWLTQTIVGIYRVIVCKCRVIHLNSSNLWSNLSTQFRQVVRSLY